MTTGASSQSITLGNSEGDAYNWSAVLDPSAPSFVSISSASSGTNLTKGATTPLTISVNATGLPGGSTYSTNVTIIATDSAPDSPSGNPATGSPITVPITINVAPPALQLSATSLSYTTTAGTNPADQTITITLTVN